ncbi:MAG: hypothetical protein IJC51_01210, partial [Eggerthellaceae bacterium]|nr:hypothetical protein [Eggerthellaceae bacterium]
MDMSGARARLLRSVLALLVAALALLALCSCAPAMREEGSADSVPEEPFTVVAEGLSTNPGDALENSTYLQLMMNRLSRGGGGVVIIPEGVYRFAATSTHSLGDFAIKACDNVKVVGAGEGKTVLKPVGRWSETGRF